jgi:PAS domain S-box-containing protein
MQTTWSLRVYFALLFALVVGGACAVALYVDREANSNARHEAQEDALFSAKTAAGQLDNHVAVLKATVAGLAANPQIAQVLDHPEGCTLSFLGLGGPDKGHLDVIRADGTVACSSRALTADGADAGYGQSSWLRGALTSATFLAPVRDDIVGGQVAVVSAPMAGGKGAIVAFADLTALGPHLATLYGGGRPTVFLVTTADNRTVIARSMQPAQWIGKSLDPGFTNPKLGSEWRDLDGVTRLYAHAPNSKGRWNVYVGEDKSAVLASVTQLRNRQLTLIGAGLLLLLLAAALIYRKVASPIRRLSGAVRTARGDDAAAPVPVTGPSEVRALAEDVNALTEAVQRELHERREAEKNYRLLFEGNPNPMWVFEANTHRFLLVNDAAVASYGYSHEEFLAMVIEDLGPAEEVDRLHFVLTDPELHAGLRNIGIWGHTRKDGTRFDAEMIAHKHHFQGQEAWVVMALEVAERLEAQQALRRSEARYRDLLESRPA